MGDTRDYIESMQEMGLCDSEGCIFSGDPDEDFWERDSEAQEREHRNRSRAAKKAWRKRKAAERAAEHARTTRKGKR